MRSWVAFMLLIGVACEASRGPSDAAAGVAPPQRYALTVSKVDRRFATRDHFIAAVEMQFSGEPFAQAMGRDVTGFSRDYSCDSHLCSPDGYLDPNAMPSDAGAPKPRIDLAGFSSAIESYEYSKQPMNNLAFESGAGTSLLYGPVLNPERATGAAALNAFQAWAKRMASASNATAKVIVGSPPDGHPLGWPGLWPTLQPFEAWDPTIHPTPDADCSLSSDDNPGKIASLLSEHYECDYTTLNLPDRAVQTSATIGPGASGWAGWKDALWTLNYLQLMHDVREGPVTGVVEAQLAGVGQPGNTIGPGFTPGTYLGSSNIEGFQAGNFLQILDNQAEQWLLELATTDGKTLAGFESIGTALAYGKKDALRWFPASLRVAEVPDEASGFPRPSAYAIASASSHLLDLAGLLGAYASAYALTDRKNALVGGSQAARVYFDGDPFPEQNQTPSGESSLHDRALAMVRVAFVNLDRLHFDEERGLLADDAEVKRGGAVARGGVLSSDVAAYTLLALRTARRALDSALTLYGNTTPDTAAIPCPLDAFPLGGSAAPFSRRLDQLITMLAEAFYDKLTTSDGRAFGGWELAKGAPSDDGASLDAHTAAIRGLLIAQLATGAIRYRDRAERVFERLEHVFYDPSARVYRAAAGDRSLEVRFTPRRFGLLQGALRDSYELIATLPGNGALRALIEDRVGRLNKLVLNGWDDRDGDQRVLWPDECAQLGRGPAGEPLGLGGLQMAERSLTGENGVPADPSSAEAMTPSDREHDCVPEVSAVGLPAALASAITFRLTPLAQPKTPPVVADAGADAEAGSR